MKPADANALITRGNAAMRQGQVAAALGCYEAALALQPDRFEALANLGSALLAAGRFDAARLHLRRAVGMRPQEAPLHVALARACVACGEPGEAEESFRRALALRPSDAATLVEFGTLLRHRGAFDAAAGCYGRALELEPARAPAHYGLGLCLRERGDMGGAIACFERAIAAQPEHVDAHYRLAVLAPDDPGGARLAQLERLGPRAAALRMPQRIRYGFTLGRLRESAGRFDAAFAAYAEANRLQWHRLGLDKAWPAREALQARFVERIRGTFTRAQVERVQRPPSAGSRVPVFIVGMPRSGTSLIEHMLAMHPAVSAGGELRVLPDLLEQAFGFAEAAGGGAYPEVVPSLPAGRLQELGEAYLERAFARVPEAGRLTDKLTGNVLHAGMIHLMLPQAKVILALRDPRDACFSCYANLFARDNVAWSYDLGALGRQCARCTALMEYWRRVLPRDAVTSLRYEDLVAAPERELRRLLDFLGLPWDPRCLDFHRQRRAVHTVSAGQVQRPMYTNSIARWRRFEKHLGPLLAALREGDAAPKGARRPARVSPA